MNVCLSKTRKTFGENFLNFDEERSIVTWLTDEELSSPAATIRVLRSSGLVNSLDLLRSFCDGPPTHWLIAWQVQRLASNKLNQQNGVKNFVMSCKFYYWYTPNTDPDQLLLHLPHFLPEHELLIFPHHSLVIDKPVGNNQQN